MVTLNINYQVFMTYTHSLEKTNTIGTDGLATCVGIIATYKNNDNIFCGHMSCSISGMPSNETSIKEKTKELILKYLGTKEAVDNVYCCTASLKEPTSKWMLEAIKETYSKVSYKEGNGIYWNSTNPVIIGMADHLDGATKGPNSENGPFDVKQ